MDSKIKTLSLIQEEDVSSKVYIVEKSSIIQFLLDPKLDSETTTFYCNHPVSNSKEGFVKYPWIKQNDILFPDSHAEVQVKEAGVFRFYLEFSEDQEKFCHGYFIVQPEFDLPSGKILNTQSIVMQTVLTKCLGLFSDWKSRLQVAKECNYNFVHFTPIQELGQSNSNYSLRDHHKLDPRYGDNLTDKSLQLFINNIHQNWGMFSIVDLVWNHVANDCLWIKEHPEASFNLCNTSYLRPAFLVDRLLWYFNKEIMNNEWRDNGVCNNITNDGQLQNIEIILRKKLNELHLEQFYSTNIDEMVDLFQKRKNSQNNIDSPSSEVVIVQDAQYKRLKSTVNIQNALSCFSDSKEFEKHLFQLNKNKEDFRVYVINKVVESTIGHIRYHFLDSNGPKYGAVTEEHSISVRYFCYPFEDSNLEDDEQLMDDSDKANLLMAHNGWIAGGDVLKGFMYEDSHIMLCRGLFAWGDSIKLRYGDSPEDVPFLWEYMKIYTEQMARIFHGVRLDNCHNTPLNVAEYLLYHARKVRPDLFVMAELFTENEQTDNLFVNRLGINSMIRENLGAFSPHDLGRHIHRYGGPATGSFMVPNKSVLQPSVAPALFMDITHDNEPLLKKRSAFDFLPSCALVAAGSFATGSTRGFDELVPHHIHVVDDNRPYQVWSDQSTPGSVFVGHALVDARTVLNDIHTEMRANGFTEIFVDQMTPDIIAVTRHCPETHQSIITVGHCSFSQPVEGRYPKDGAYLYEDFPPLKIEGQLEEILFEGQILEKKEIIKFQRDSDFINGSTNYIVNMQKNINPNQSNLCGLQISEKGSEIHFRNFFPGSVVVLKVSGKSTAQHSIAFLRATLNLRPAFQGKSPRLHVADSSNNNNNNKDSLSNAATGDLQAIIAKLSLVDLNKVMYRCGPEESECGFGGGLFNIPGHGDLVYCGLQGIMSVISEVAENNDLGHPICNNLRQGDWLLGYTANRLKNYAGTRELATWLEKVFDHVSVLPRFLVPTYFEAVVRSVYEMCIERTFDLLSPFVKNGSAFTKNLALASVQLCGEVASARLPAVEEDATGGGEEKVDELAVTVAAGLPHFATGFMRCWGRDTFIALRGLMLIPGRSKVARTLILAYAGCVRHGLVPNLLASGISARYNARDATWFWLQAVQDYVKMVDQEATILNANVLRMYPTDDSEALVDHPKSEPLHATIHEILTCHYNGISFTERNAGVGLDRDMSQQGFNVVAGVDEENGFVRGGTDSNCGTWMDKMGSSTVANNKGVPATPRNGSAVEIVGLCKSSLRWLVEMQGEGKYPHHTITFTRNGEAHEITYKEWESKIQEHFDALFFIGPDSSLPNVHKRNIYKDTHGSSHDYLDHQLRPNFPIAICVAPEMFDPHHAWSALDMVEKHLLGPVGLRTLDPDDWNYDGFYENDLDNADRKKAKGFNYHNGPEWVWVLGPYLRARLTVARILDPNHENVLPETIAKIRVILARHKAEIVSSPWRGLTELTNKDGALCLHSCPTQAWSSACLLEVVYDLDCMCHK